MKAMLKSELAALAGVSNRTFVRWLNRHREELIALGLSPMAHVVPPSAVKFISEEYGIDVG